MFEKRVFWKASLAVAAVSTFIGSGKVDAMATSMRVHNLIHNLVESRLRSKVLVEQVTGASLSIVASSVPPHYEGRHTTLRGVAVDQIRYWRPDTIDGQIVGPHLDITLASCLLVSEAKRRYGPWDIVGVPGPEASWGRLEPWGELIFGADPKNNSCVKTISIDMRRQQEHRR